MKVFELLNTCGQMFVAYRFRSLHEDISLYWRKYHNVPGEMLHAKVMTWTIERDRMVVVVDDKGSLEFWDRMQKAREETSNGEEY